MCNQFYVFDKACNTLLKGLKNTKIQALESSCQMAFAWGHFLLILVNDHVQE